MASSLGEILTAMQNGVTAINNLRVQIAVGFPPLSSPSTTAPSAGTITFTSSQASSFVVVTTSSGAAYKLALYPST